VDGVAIPLVLETYLLWTLSHQNGPILQGTFGALDAQGAAAAAFVLPPGTSPSLVGLTAVHAALALTSLGVVTGATNPVAVTLLP
jgi:hypothetical protein